VVQRNFNGSQSTSPPGDIDGDQDIDADDVDRLATAVVAGETDLRFDLNQDGNVDRSDVTYLIENILHTSIADLNLDRRVDAADIAVFAGHFGATTQTRWSSGDINGDAAVSLADLVLFQRQFDPTFELSAAVAAAADALVIAAPRNNAVGARGPTDAVAETHRAAVTRSDTTLTTAEIHDIAATNLRAARRRPGTRLSRTNVLTVDTAIVAVSCERRGRIRLHELHLS
jgi:hypothetical protein